MVTNVSVIQVICTCAPPEHKYWRFERYMALQINAIFALERKRTQLEMDTVPEGRTSVCHDLLMACKSLRYVVYQPAEIAELVSCTIS